MFCEFQIDLYNRDESELTGNRETTHIVSVWIDLNKITAVLVSPPDEDNDIERTCIYTECGEKFTVNTKIGEVMKIINQPFSYNLKGLVRNQ